MSIGSSLEELLTRTMPHAASSLIQKHGPIVAKSIATGAANLSKEIIKIAFR